MWLLYEVKDNIKASRVSDWKVVAMYNYDENMIVFIKEFVTADEVAKLNEHINTYEIVNNKDVFYVDKIDGEHDKEREISDESVKELVRSLEQKIYKYLVDVYFPERNLEVTEHIWTRNLELIRWTTWATLGPHADGLPTPPPEPKINIGSLIYLNDEYEGGEIKFNDYDLVFAPKTGDLVIFPNHYIHEVLQVKEKQPVTRRHTLPVFYSFNTKEK